MKTCLKIAGINIFLLIAVQLLQSCVFSTGNFGPSVEEERNVGNFKELRVSSGIDITLSQGNVTRVVIIADEDVIDDVNSEVIGNELRLSVDGNWFRRGRVEARITFVDLESLDVSAGSDAESESNPFGRLPFVHIRSTGCIDVHQLRITFIIYIASTRSIHFQ